MNLRAEYEAVREELLSAVQSSAKIGDTRAVAALARVMEDVDRAIEEVARLARALPSLRERLRDPMDLHIAGPEQSDGYDTTLMESRVGRKAYGERKRRRFANIHGLDRDRGVSYWTAARRSVGIATATERIPNRWFLGLPDQKFDSVVLICEHDGRDLEFVLPTECVERIWPRLSREERNGHVKFHVERPEGLIGQFELRILGGEAVDVTPYLGNFEPLGPH